MFTRFWKSFKFYVKHVGLKNTIFVEIPSFINKSMYSDIDGVLLHSVDVTDGEATGAMMIGGNINIDNMPVTPDAAVIAKLPNINFLRRD